MVADPAPSDVPLASNWPASVESACPASLRLECTKETRSDGIKEVDSMVDEGPGPPAAAECLKRVTGGAAEAGKTLVVYRRWGTGSPDHAASP